MTLVRTSLLNGMAVAVRLGTSLVLNKILAVYVGPAGYAAIGQLQNIMAVVTTFAAGALNTGVTKHTAEYHGDDARRIRLWRTAGSLSVIGSLMFGLVVAVFSRPLAETLLGSAGYAAALLWLALCLTFISLNAFLLAILAGSKEVARFVVANIAGSLLSLLISGALAWRVGLEGVLAALSIGQAVSLAATVLACRGLPWLRPALLFGRIDRGAAKALGRFVVMALTSAIALPTAQILVRSHLVDSFDASRAGYWDAINKISGVYLSLATTTLTLYYLPRIAEIRDRTTLRREIVAGYRLIVPLTALAAAVIYATRERIVVALFAPSFLPMTDLFAWQLTGDVIKIASWLSAYVLVGKAMLRHFVVTEVAFAISLVLLTIVATRAFGFAGVAIAYAVNYLLYLGIMFGLVFMTDRLEIS